MMDRCFFILACLLFHLMANCQNKPRPITYDSSIVHVDSIKIKSLNYNILHYHKISRSYQQKILSDYSDDILMDNLNDYSRLIFSNGRYSFNIPTIPLTNIIYLQQYRIIIGLSSIEMSPYHLVIYSENGKLLHKARFLTLELKLDKSKLKELLSSHPALRSCLSQMNIVKENDTFCLEISKCLIKILGREFIGALNAYCRNHYFPLMNSPTDIPATQYGRATNFF
jgi:hypothetical protein